MKIHARTLAGALLVCVLAGWATPAAAHPFGPPSTARIEADGSRVTISWLPAEDDWVALGQSLGAFEDPSTGTVSTELTGEQKLERSTALRDYLLEKITVAQAGRPCESRLEELRALLVDGARFVFDCRSPVTEVDVTIAALTDLNTAYRTMLIAGDSATPRQTLFTEAVSTRRLSFSGSGGNGGSGQTTSVAVGTAVLLAGAGAFVVLRTRRRVSTTGTRS
ncbi:hypothetical protein ACFQVD_04380 [Streptosporangium amethystogenes subsp. fukuiense]|uniref:LPXTG-motif cell wall anchor domain-containing protein n=1 Tax=Streptosporangium amethystogenes subsp. fukuiense TaxID=698418 RepID=A0ABW2STH2_9ACTN